MGKKKKYKQIYNSNVFAVIGRGNDAKVVDSRGLLRIWLRNTVPIYIFVFSETFTFIHVFVT